jgi:4-hydroxy-2-oxoheptanedioate aldolase
LLTVDGVDVFFVGPSDLSQAMGHPGNPKAPPVAAAIDKTFAAVAAAKRISGTPATADNVADVLGKGVRYIYTHLPRLLSSSAQAYLAKARAARL